MSTAQTTAQKKSTVSADLFHGASGFVFEVTVGQTFPIVLFVFGSPPIQTRMEEPTYPSLSINAARCHLISHTSECKLY